MTIQYIGTHASLAVPEYETVRPEEEEQETVQTQTTVTTPQRQGSAPSMPNLPEYNAPEYDERKVDALAQKKAAPELNRLRQLTQQAMAKTYENPNVQRMTVRQALAGYGTGLGGIMAGAQSAATNEYGKVYSATVQAALTNYQANVNATMQHYNNLFQDYMNGGQESTTTITRPE